MATSNKAPESSDLPLYAILNEIMQAAKNGLPLIAISQVVALPDICVSLESADGRSDGTRYKQWCADNLNDRLSYVTPEDLWSMRCGVLHNGRFGDLKHSVERVIFVPPGGTTFVNCVSNGAYLYGVVDFCGYFCNCVFLWCETNKDKELVKSNMQRLMQYRPGGLPPHIGGADCPGLKRPLTYFENPLRRVFYCPQIIHESDL